MKKFNSFLILLYLLLFGCAGPGLKNMVPVLERHTLYKSDKSIKVGTVVGGIEKNEFTNLVISSVQFKDALIQSLYNSEILQLKDSEECDYKLSAYIMDQYGAQFRIITPGFSTTAQFVVNYILFNSQGNKIWSKTITSEYTSKHFTAKRKVLAVEGSVRENIKTLLLELSNLRL